MEEVKVESPNSDCLGGKGRWSIFLIRGCQHVGGGGGLEESSQRKFLNLEARKYKFHYFIFCLILGEG